MCASSGFRFTPQAAIGTFPHCTASGGKRNNLGQPRQAGARDGVLGLHYPSSLS